ncbi:hypothetical protein MNB_SV-12-600 [hydrothermal vent metagenome]|uniref:FlgO domain-containing protein n=1 Tax=hydrothermal vent metagenome TaxID=652676 RepID=A0A1W1BQV3_9ZZZZ
MIVKKSIKKMTLSLLLINSLAFGASNLETGVSEIGEQISKSMLNEGKKKIAVIEFSDLNDNVNNLGRFLVEELINELMKHKKDKGYEIVERRQLNKVLRQLKLSSSGLLDPKSMKEVGKILNVDAIVTGSLTDLGNDIKVNARIISVESAKIISTASTKIPKVGSVATLMSQNSVKVSSASTNSSSKSSSTKSSDKSKEFKYTNKNLEITYRNIKRSKGEISMVAVYQNTSKSSINLAVQGDQTNITDENGEVWIHKKSSLIFNNPFDGTNVIPPKRKLISKMTFIAKGATDGKVFNLTAKYGYSVYDKDKFTVVINNIKIEENR